MMLVLFVMRTAFLIHKILECFRSSFSAFFGDLSLVLVTKIQNVGNQNVKTGTDPWLLPVLTQNIHRNRVYQIFCSDFVKDSYHFIEHEVQEEKIFDKCRLQSMAWH